MRGQGSGLKGFYETENAIQLKVLRQQEQVKQIKQLIVSSLSQSQQQQQEKCFLYVVIHLIYVLASQINRDTCQLWVVYTVCLMRSGNKLLSRSIRHTKNVVYGRSFRSSLHLTLCCLFLVN